MTTWALLAPGPSASAEQAAAVHAAGIPLGAVGCAYQLAPHAQFIAATDSSWWRKYPEAKQVDCRRYTMHTVAGVAKIVIRGLGVCNSGVLGLECAKKEGATRILLLGFDMRGSHFFGPYTNGLRNTDERKRTMHLKQYAKWSRINPNIEVINCTQGSALACFPTARLDDFCRDVQMGDAGVSGDLLGAAREHDASDGGEALSEAAQIHLRDG